MGHFPGVEYSWWLKPSTPASRWLAESAPPALQLPGRCRRRRLRRPRLGSATGLGVFPFWNRSDLRTCILVHTDLDIKIR